MADTSYQKYVVEPWVRDIWMPSAFGVSFAIRECRLITGGAFEFDAVSPDGLMVGCISTSSGKTKGGNFGTGKMHKLRSDMLHLIMAEGASRRLLILTEDDMFAECRKQEAKGRVHPLVELIHAPLPADMSIALSGHRGRASEGTMA